MPAGLPVQVNDGSGELSVSGTGALVKDSSATSTLTLTGVSSYSGAIAVDAGTMQLGGAGQLGSGSYTGPVTLAAGTSLRHSSSANQTLAGVVSGAGSLVKDSNAGSLLILAADNSYSGGTTVSAGVLQVGKGGTTGRVGDVLDNATLSFNRSDSYSYGGIVSGSGALHQNGSGTLSLTGLSTYTGNTTVSQGTLEIASTGALGGGTYAGAVSLANGASLVHSASVDQTLSGAISGSGVLRKTGSASLTLGGSNQASYSGAMSLSGGKLVMAGAAALGSGTLAVSAGTLDIG